MEKIKISEVIVFKRKREPKDLTALKQSIRDLGLINPITINKQKVLIAGYHRLLACKEMGWLEIPAITINYDNLKSELAQIDENIVRNPLTVLENAEQLTRRKQIYETLHPETKAESIRDYNLKQNSPDSKVWSPVKPVTFVNDAASKTGKSKSSIHQFIQIGSSLTKEIIEMLKGTPMEDNLSELMALIKIETPEKQKELIEKVLNGQAKSIRHAIKQEQPPKAIDLNKPTVSTRAYADLLDELHELKLQYAQLQKFCDDLQELLEKSTQPETSE